MRFLVFYLSELLSQVHSRAIVKFNFSEGYEICETLNGEEFKCTISYHLDSIVKYGRHSRKIIQPMLVIDFSDDEINIPQCIKAAYYGVAHEEEIKQIQKTIKIICFQNDTESIQSISPGIIKGIIDKDYAVINTLLHKRVYKKTIEKYCGDWPYHYVNYYYQDSLYHFLSLRGKDMVALKNIKDIIELRHNVLVFTNDNCFYYLYIKMGTVKGPVIIPDGLYISSYHPQIDGDSENMILSFPVYLRGEYKGEVYYSAVHNTISTNWRYVDSLSKSDSIKYSPKRRPKPIIDKNEAKGNKTVGYLLLLMLCLNTFLILRISLKSRR
jgi:hypothetical protein